VSCLSVEVKVLELERKVDVLSRAFYLMLFEDAEVLPKEELEELKELLSGYVQGKREDFVSLDELLG